MTRRPSSYDSVVDAPRLIRLPPIAFDQALAEVVAAIQLDVAREAPRVRLSGLRRSDEVASEALALAQAAGVRFALQHGRRNGPATIFFGPVEA
jgi:hypothetical protein